MAMSSDAVRAFGREVRRRRIALNMTLETLAEQVGLSPSYVGNVEMGNQRRGLSLDAAFRIATGMGSNLPDLLGGYTGLSAEGMEAGRLIDAILPFAKRPILELLRGLAQARVAA
jgi:transcriptional regulator with XRE-family HTH domain